MSAASLSQERQPLKLDVVSVQSQVVYGRVGNNAAVPTLEALGLSVAAVPTVVFSNIPSYPTIHGGALPIEWFSGYLQDLSARGALDVLRAVQVGYLGSPAQAEELDRWLRALLTRRPDLHIVIDPVIGDQDHGVYGAEGMAEVYRQRLAALANGLTPNGFELAVLTGLPVDDLEAVVTAARTLLTGRTEWVVVTSAAPGTWLADEMQAIVVIPTQVHVIAHPRIDAALAGTGDLFTATLTGHWLNGMALQDAAVKACEHVVRALRRTEQARSRELLLPHAGGRHNHERVVVRELPVGHEASTPTQSTAKAVP